MNRFDIKTYVKERNEALIDFVETDSMEKINEYIKKYKLVDVTPKDITIVKAGLYKAVQFCTDIPDEVKDKALKKCLELGFNPLIKPIESEDK